MNFCLLQHRTKSRGKVFKRWIVNGRPTKDCKEHFKEGNCDQNWLGGKHWTIELIPQKTLETAFLLIYCKNYGIPMSRRYFQVHLWYTPTLQHTKNKKRLINKTSHTIYPSSHSSQPPKVHRKIWSLISLLSNSKTRCVSK